MEQALDRSLIGRWAEAFRALVEERSRLPDGLAPRGPGRFYLSLPWAEPFADPAVFAHPAVLGVLDRVFAQEYVLVQLAADTPVLGSGYQELHRDYRPLFSDDVQTPLYALAVNLPLCDVGPDEGPLEMVPGTHRIPREQALAEVADGRRAVVSYPMRAGDIAIRTPLALHRGTPNRTERMRPMVVLGYVMHWLYTPKVDLVVPHQAWEGLLPELRRLLRCRVVDRLPAAPAETYVEFAY